MNTLIARFSHVPWLRCGAVLALLAVPMMVVADEGMWMPQQVPALGDELRKLGLQIDPNSFADLTSFPFATAAAASSQRVDFSLLQLEQPEDAESDRSAAAIQHERSRIFVRSPERASASMRRDSRIRLRPNAPRVPA